MVETKTAEETVREVATEEAGAKAAEERETAKPGSVTAPPEKGGFWFHLGRGKELMAFGVLAIALGGAILPKVWPSTPEPQVGALMNSVRTVAESIQSGQRTGKPLPELGAIVEPGSEAMTEIVEEAGAPLKRGWRPVGSAAVIRVRPVKVALARENAKFREVEVEIEARNHFTIALDGGPAQRVHADGSPAKRPQSVLKTVRRTVFAPDSGAWKLVQW